MSTQDKLYPWRIALVRHAIVGWITLPFIISEAFWTAWSAVTFPERKKK